MDTPLVRIGAAIIISLTATGCVQARLTTDEVRVVPQAALPVVWSAVSQLSPYADNRGNGFAEASYDEQVFKISLRANLDTTEGGAKYMAWLIREKPATIVLLGSMQPEKNGNSYSLTYKTGLDLRDHKRIVITLEPANDADAMPSEPVLFGNILSVR